MVTIAIPFYNAELFLDYAIKSVLKQTYNDWVLFLMDDGSSDNSLTIARKYEKGDARIKVYSDGLNKNLPTRLNEIASLAQTKYLARMDADDIMHPNRIKKQLEILEANPEIDVLGSNAYSIDENNEIQGLRIKCDLNNPKLICVKSFIHPTIIAKTEWYRTNPYDVNALRIEDYELWKRTSSKSVFKVYTEPLLFYREFGNNYYKKYFKGIKSQFYVARKLKKPIYYYIAVNYLLKGLVYRVFNWAGKENMLLNRRFHSISNDIIKKEETILQRVIA